MSTLPANIPPPTIAAGGVAVLVPAAPSDHSGALGVVSPVGGSPFDFVVGVPAPPPGSPPVGVRVQPETALAQGTTPPGAAVAKVIAIDVFDPLTGALVHDHDPPLLLAIQLSGEEQAVCARDPGRIALLHVDAAGRVRRMPIEELDCAAGLLRARLATTSRYAVARLDRATSVTQRVYVPLGSRPN